MDKNRWSHGMSEGRCHETEQEEGRLVEMINSTAEEAGKKNSERWNHQSMAT